MKTLPLSPAGLRLAVTALLAVTLVLAARPAARAQDTLVTTVLHNFTGSDGSGPGDLVEGDDGNFYGVTGDGGFDYTGQAGTGNGTVFRITPAGGLTTIYVFSGSDDGGNPVYGLTKGRDGNFYGSTSSGGTKGGGTVFRITPTGELTTIYSSDFPGLTGPLVQDDNGNLYGVSYVGGPETADYGSVFRLTPAGVYTTLHVFTGDADGAAASALTRGSDGNFYAVGNLGGNFSGTIYRVTPAGEFTTLYTFTGKTDGFLPNSLTLGGDGNLYGTTQAGGTDFYGVVFRITNAGQFTVLYDFTGGSDSGVPIGNLVLGLDGNFYGIAGGDTLPEATPDRRTARPMVVTNPPTPPEPRVIVHPSTVFRITPAGALTTLYASDSTVGQFIQGSDGSFYGAGDDTGGSELPLVKRTVVPHPTFFTGQAPLVDGVDYLAFSSGNIFGYYTFLSDPSYLYHFDLGYEYVFDARDGRGGVYLYDFASSDFFYTSPIFPFPYLYDFGLKSVLYYFPDPSNPGHYNTGGVRYFYDFSTGTVISK